MKIALVHDGIFCKAGGERVLLSMHQAFPEAPIYTSIYDPDASFPEFKNCDIRTSGFQKIAKTEKQFKRLFYPFAISAMKRMDLSQYDVILISTTHCGKYIHAGPDSLVIAYCHTPFRLAWNPESYDLYANAKGLKKFILNKLINRLKKIDYQFAQRPDHYIANATEITQRIRNAYHFKKEIPVIHPSIDCNRYHIESTIDDYYLVVSRLEKYKKADLVIDTFNKIKKPLKVVGRGVEKKKLVSKAGPNIEFIEGVDDHELARIYARCRALIFPQHEDYGLTPLECCASGRPVIAYGNGGVLETMIPFKDDSRKSTAVFFNEQNTECLAEAIVLFEKLSFDPAFIRQHAEKFDNRIFIEQIRNFVTDYYHRHRKTT